MKILRQSEMVKESEAELWCNFYPRNNSFTLHPFCLPSFFAKWELLVFPVWLQPQTALISCAHLHISSTDLACTQASPFPASTLAQMFLTALWFPHASLFSSCWCPSPENLSFSYAVLLWPLVISIAVSLWFHTSHTCDTEIKITTGAGWRHHYSNPASGSWTRSGASKRELRLTGYEIHYGTRKLGWLHFEDNISRELALKQTHPLAGFESVENQGPNWIYQGWRNQEKTIM